MKNRLIKLLSISCFLIIFTLLQNCKKADLDTDTNCNYTTYNGSVNCSSKDGITVTDDICCPISLPYYCSSSNKCYESCDEAKVDCGSNVIKGQNGGGGSCNYTTYSGTNNCSSSGQIAVTDNICCATTTPYYCSSNNKCYSSCVDAKAACGTSVIKGQNGGEGSCNYTTYNGAKNCSSSGMIAVADNVCCSTSNPYYCSSTSKCYATCDNAKAACGSSVIKGQNGSGSGSCSGSMNSSLIITPGTQSGCPSGSTARQVIVKNNASVSVRVRVCFIRSDGIVDNSKVRINIGPGESETFYSSISCSPGYTITAYSVKSIKESEGLAGCILPNCP